jgi:hypothetical protein
MRTLQFGDKGEDVIRLQNILSAQGFFSFRASGNFLNRTKEAVLYFQQTHLGPDCKFLEVDGIVGEDTWWALKHPSGKPQKSDFPGRIPRKLTPLRSRLLEIALKEHDDKVHEIPNGSNWGDGIIKYGGQPGWAWCCLFWSWCNRECFGKYSLGRKYASCFQAKQRSQTLGLWRDKDDYNPIPGDTFIMLYRDENGNFNGKGHIGFVMRVRYSGAKAVSINTVEGNCGNRVKIGMRYLGDPKIVGFINDFHQDEQPVDWQTGLVRAKSVGTATTR